MVEDNLRNRLLHVVCTEHDMMGHMCRLNPSTNCRHFSSQMPRNIVFHCQLCLGDRLGNVGGATSAMTKEILMEVRDYMWDDIGRFQEVAAI